MKKKKLEKLAIILLFIIAVGIIFYFIKTNNLSINKKEEESIAEVDLEEQKDLLELHYLDVGQGDSSLIKLGDKSILIDGGTRDNKEKIETYLKDNKVFKINYLIATHPHEDHIGSLSYIVDNFEVDNVILPDVIHNTKSFENLIDSIMAKKINTIKAKSGTSYDLGGSEFIILAPNSSKYKNLNNYSVAIKLDYGKTSFIFTGDAEKLSEDEMIKKYSSYLKADVLKLGHHGSNTSSSDKFIELVDPQIAIVSAGENNKYNHPNKEVVDKLEKRNVNILSTIDKGNILLLSDGEKIELDDGSFVKADDLGILDILFYFMDKFIS